MPNQGIKFASRKNGGHVETYLGRFKMTSTPALITLLTFNFEMKIMSMHMWNYFFLEYAHEIAIEVH